MAHFAKVVNGIVDHVIVAEAEFFDTFVDTTPGEWIQCSYNGTIRYNYPGTGYTYDAARDAFYEPQPYASWILNEETCRWEPPIPAPDSGPSVWNEETLTWDEVDGN